MVGGVLDVIGGDVVGRGCGVVGGGCGVVGCVDVVRGSAVVGDGVAGSIVVDGVMMVSGEQVESLVYKVTSARCTQLELEGGVNTKVSTGRIEQTV